MGKIPDWAKAHQTKNTKIKEVNGKFYLYSCHCVYDKQTRKRKLQTKYLGALDEEAGLVPKGQRRTKTVEVLPSDHAEYGVTGALSVMGREIATIRRMFPDCWRTMLGAAYCRLLHQSPIKDMAAIWGRSFLSKMLPDTPMGPNQISQVLSGIGDHRAAMVKYFNAFAAEGDTILFDGTDLLTRSRGMGGVRVAKTKKGDFRDKLNLMLVFSVGQNRPVAFRILNGNVVDVRAFVTFAKELDAKKVIIIADKGFYSQPNIDFLDEVGLQYILAIKRSSSLIDYGPVWDDCLDESRGTAMLYHGREIMMYEQPVDEGHNVHLCIDKDMRQKEDRRFCQKIHEAQKALLEAEIALEDFEAKVASGKAGSNGGSATAAAAAAEGLPEGAVLQAGVVGSMDDFVDKSDPQEEEMAELEDEMLETDADESEGAKDGGGEDDPGEAAQGKDGESKEDRERKALVLRLARARAAAKRYSWDNLRKLRKKFGTISFLTPKTLVMGERDKRGNQVLDADGRMSLVPASSGFVYRGYKTRNYVEESIDVLVNKLDADRSYMQSKEAEEGWMFINFIALQWYYNLLNAIDSSSLRETFSVTTSLTFLSKVEKGKIAKDWLTMDMTKAEEEIVKALGVDISSGIDKLRADLGLG